MAASVVQIVCICTGVFSHCSIMWWETGIKTFHTSGLNLTLCSAGSHRESGHVPLQVFPLGFSSHSPVPGHSFSSFLWPEIQDVSWSFSHLQYRCSCSTLRLCGGGKATREKRKKRRQWESYPCAVTSASFGSFLQSTYFCLLFSLQVILYFAQNFRSVREVGYMWMELLFHANKKTSKKVHKFYIEKLLSFHQEFWIFVFFLKKYSLSKDHIYM